MAEPRPVLLLPDHVMEDIFARLPAKSVYRCRCLSRAWAATLSSDDFADRHLRLANHRGGPRILLLQDSARHGPKMHAWSPDHPVGTTLMEELPHALTCEPPLVVAFRAGTPRAAADTGSGSLVPLLLTQQCRGLVVIEATATGTHYVFNPSTGQMAALPAGRPTSCGRPNGSYHIYASIGLGYDTRTRKHKVVRIYYRGSGAEQLIPEFAGCEVYVINNSMGLWRRPAASDGARADREKPPGWVCRNETSVFAQGHVHWLAQRKLDGSLPDDTFIVSFSPGDETFGTVPLPPPPLDMERKGGVLKHHLTELDGRLCLFRTDFYHSCPCRHDVWLLRGHGTCTWDLHCRIDLADTTLPPEAKSFMNYGAYGGRITPLAVIDNGRRIVLIRRRFPMSCAPSFKMCAYASVTGDIENLLQLDGIGLVSHQSMVLRHAVVYEESIASPGAAARGHHLRHVAGAATVVCTHPCKAQVCLSELVRHDRERPLWSSTM